MNNILFDKLSDYINVTTIYTGKAPQNEAIDWLMSDTLGYSSCAYEHFVERYALSVINFAAPIEVGNESSARMDNGTIDEKNKLWIRPGRQCVWKNVACTDGSVTELDVGGTSVLRHSGMLILQDTSK